jgi:hypothetical protein
VGFPTTLAKSASEDAFPFGLFFANADTVYVADEGNGTATYDPATGSYSAAAAQTTAGLQKWVFNGTQWNLVYTLSTGLNLGQPYSVAGYPAGDNAATGLPWAPATDGLRNITGRVNPNGTVTIWAVTSTVSGSGDQGADPNKLVAITDKLSAAALPGGEQFVTVRSANCGEVLRACPSRRAAAPCIPSARSTAPLIAERAGTGSPPPVRLPGAQTPRRAGDPRRHRR